MTKRLLGRLELQVIRDTETQQRKIVFRNQNGELLDPADNPELMATLVAGGVTPADLSAALATKANASSLAAKVDTATMTAAISAQHTVDNGTYAGHALLAYDDFTVKTDGALNSRAAASGQAWIGTGASPPYVDSGALVADGTGYGWLDAGAAINLVVAEIVWTGSGTNQTFTIAVSPTNNLISNLIHFNTNPNGWNLSWMVNGVWSTAAPSQPQAVGTWLKPMVNGVTYRIAFALHGDTASVIGPNGERFSILDSRNIANGGRYFFVEPVGKTAGRYPRLQKVAAYGALNQASSAIQRLSGSGVGEMTKGTGEVVGNRYTMWETTIGRQTTSGLPSVTFGPTYVLTYLEVAASPGDTTVTTRTPLSSGVDSIIIDPQGPTSETVVPTGSFAGTGPYTRTVPALANAHPVGTPVLCTNIASSKRASIEFNPANGFLSLPNLSYVNGTLYIGSSLDVNMARAAAGVLSLGPSATACLRTGKAATASRPSASTVGQGSQFYDTTLNKPIWSDGTNWRDAAGTVV